MRTLVVIVALVSVAGIDATFDMNAVPELFSTTSDVNIVLCAGFCEAGIVL